MADKSSVLIATPRPLTVADAAGLEASVIPTLWSPSQILETDFNTPLPAVGDLSADGDVWRITIQTPSAMPTYVFYPIALRGTLVDSNSTSQFDALFEDTGMASNEGVFEDGEETPHNYFEFTIAAAFQGFDFTGDFKLRTMTMPFPGFPPKLPLSETGAPINDALGALMLRVGTFSAVGIVDTSLHIDARWLAFPRSALKSSGFYLPRLYFRPN